MVYQQVDAEGVLFSLRDEVYFGVNETAARVWQLLEQAPATAEDVVRLMADAYPDAPADELAMDVHELLVALEANDLIGPAAGAMPAAMVPRASAQGPSSMQDA